VSSDLVNAFLERASNKLSDSRTLSQTIRYAEAVSAAQESIELSAKAVFLLLTPTYPRKHDFTEDEFLAVLDRLPPTLEHYNFPRLYLLHRFWASFYTTAKYGLEVVGAPAKKLFEQPEAELAQRHANSWNTAAIALRATLQAQSTNQSSTPSPR
jgi:HEPN domain-containing protein